MEPTAPGDDIIQVFIQAYKSGTKRTVSKLYKGLVSARTNSTEYIKTNWEKELDINITVEEWVNMCKTQFSSTNSRMWREFCWKNLVRFFITPKIKSRQLKTDQPCWRQCGHKGVGHAHMFWLCPKLQEYWKDIHSTIESILCFDIPKTCPFLLLGNIPEDWLTKDKYLIKIFLAASKKAITRRWYQQDPPSKENWLDIIKEIHSMESLTFVLRLQEDKSQQLWEKWTFFSATYGQRTGTT